MRYIKHSSLAVVMLSLVIVFTGCKKDKDSGSGTPGATAPVTCKVNGAAWNSLGQDDKVLLLGDTANGVEASLEVDTLSFTAISVKGTDTTVLIFSTTVDSDRIGSYTLSAASGNFGLYFPGVDFPTFYSTIIAYNSIATGTFNITGYDAAKQTISGNFNISMDSPDAGKPDYFVTEGSFRDIKLR